MEFLVFQKFCVADLSFYFFILLMAFLVDQTDGKNKECDVGGKVADVSRNEFGED